MDQKRRLYLHIGRNKAGSTSLQDFFLVHRENLAKAGICFRPYGHLMKLAPGVPGFATHYDMIEYARSSTAPAYLLSNEFMSSWPEDFTKSFVADLADFDIRVIAYLRPYGDWVSSTYAQEVKAGMTRQDFDTYFERFRPRVSAWPNLESWGVALGWDRLRIRSLDSRDLVDGDLIADCLSALSLDPHLAAGARRSNTAPHWVVLEMLRALVEEEDRLIWSEAASRVVRPLQKLMEECLTRHAVPSVAYLTPQQARWSANLYNRDIARIAELIGTKLQPEIPAGHDRKMPPSLDQIPGTVFRDWSERAASADFRASHPEAAEAAARLTVGRNSLSGRFSRLLARLG